MLRNKITGFIGRLGDLGFIDQKYDIAVSSACYQLNNYITIEDAEHCIKYLKETKAGRATFISIDKCQWVINHMKKEFKAPSQTNRLFDLIHVQDERYKAVFYFCLKNTLVCENIDIATEHGYGQNRHRCVTLIGEIIEPNGSMSGGGRAKQGLLQIHQSNGKRNSFPQQCKFQ